MYKTRLGDAARRIWIVSEVFGTHENSTGYVLSQLADGLSGEFAVSIISSRPAPEAEGRTPVWKRALRGLKEAASLSSRLFRSARRGDVALVVTNPPFLPFVATVAGSIRGLSVVVLVQDVYPDALRAVNGSKRGLLSRLFDGLNTWALARARSVVVIGRDMEELVRRKVGHEAAHIRFIPNWLTLPGEIAPVRERALDEFVVQYSGKLGQTHNGRIILDAARILLDRGSRVRIEVYTWGAQVEEFAASMRERGLTNIHLLPPRPREQLAAHLANCDAGLVTMTPGMTGVSVPCRIYNLLASGRPVIAAVDRNSEVGRVVEEAGAGLVVDPDSGADLADAIETLAVNPARLRPMLNRGRTYVQQHNSYEQVLAAYRTLLRPLLSPADAGNPLRRRVVFKVPDKIF